MAKKANTTKKVEVEPQIETMEEVVTEFFEDTVVAEPKARERLKPANEWEIKDRVYFLKNGKKPLSRSIKATGVYYFDKEKGYERELKYCQNQKTSFVDEMKGDQRLEHIVFRSGSLYVPKEQTVLQKLLSLYHPDLNNIYKEYKPQQIATNEVEWIEYELAALNMAKGLSLDEAEGILRVEIGEQVNDLSSAELKRDVLIFARKNPQLFLELATDDNTQLRNFGVKSVEQGILNLSQDQRTFTYGTNGRKVMTVPFDEHPYSALSAFFKTDEGMEIYKAIEKRLK